MWILIEGTTHQEWTTAKVAAITILYGLNGWADVRAASHRN
jgi:hypothetical protein